MADDAVPLLGICKDRQAVDRSGRKRLFVAAILILIERRVAAEQRSLEAGQRPLNLSKGYAPGSKRMRKLGRVRGILSQSSRQKPRAADSSPIGLAIGKADCASKLGARPSQNCTGE